jgi:hypothetical protein
MTPGVLGRRNVLNLCLNLTKDDHCRGSNACSRRLRKKTCDVGVHLQDVFDIAFPETRYPEATSRECDDQALAGEADERFSYGHRANAQSSDEVVDHHTLARGELTAEKRIAEVASHLLAELSTTVEFNRVRSLQPNHLVASACLSSTSWRNLAARAQ